MKTPTTTVDSLLAKYHIAAPVTNERFLVHGDVTRGTRLHLFCFDSRAFGKCIAVTSQRVKWLRQCPLSKDDAAQLIRELHDAGAIRGTRQEQQTLKHLLVRCSRLYMDEGLQWLRLAPVYLRENGYRLGTASMWSKTKITARKRLDSHAHDKAAVFAHRR